MSNCLECGKDLPTRTEGKRERKFCDNKGACKQKYWVKQNAKKPDTVTLPKDKFEENKLYTWVGGELISYIPNKLVVHGEEKSATVVNKKVPESTIPRLEGESSLDYRIRCAELNKQSKI